MPLQVPFVFMRAGSSFVSWKYGIYFESLLFVKNDNILDSWHLKWNCPEIVWPSKRKFVKNIPLHYVGAV
jgi:hypothetical protein